MNFSHLNHSMLRGMKLEGHVARLGEREMQAVLWLGNLKEKRQPGRPWCIWKTNIKTHFKEIGCEGVEKIQLTQDRDKWW